MSKEEEKVLMSYSPPVDSSYPELQQLILRVRNGNSIYQKEAKSLKNTLKFVAQLMTSKLSAMKKSAIDQTGLMNFDVFFQHYIQTNYGLDKLATKYAEIFL